VAMACSIIFSPDFSPGMDGRSSLGNRRGMFYPFAGSGFDAPGTSTAVSNVVSLSTSLGNWCGEECAQDGCHSVQCFILRLLNDGAGDQLHHSIISVGVVDTLKDQLPVAF
jgi:hypothetical protein